MQVPHMADGRLKRAAVAVGGKRAPALVAAALVVLVSTAASARNVPPAEALKRRIDVNFVDTPFESAMGYVAKRTGTNLVIDRAEVDRDESRHPVTFRVKDIPALEVVTWITRMAGVGFELSDKALVVTSTSALRSKRIELRIYSIHDLTLEIPDFPGPSIMPDTVDGFGGRRGVAFSAERERDLGMSAEAIAEFISTRVQPGSWDASLGTSVEERGGKLVIVQATEVHEEIERLLGLLRKNERRMVSFHVRALRAPSSEVKRALERTARDGTLEADAIERLTRLGRLEPGRLLATTRFTCFNTQRTHGWGGERTDYVGDLEISGDSYDPVVLQLRQGLSADVRPVVSDDGRAMIQELRLGYSYPGNAEFTDFRPVGEEVPAEVDAAPNPVPAPGALQLPRLPVTEFATTVRMPTGSTMMFAASPPDGAAGGDDEEIVFLVTATAVTF
ncbi:MAG: hypothetical protein ACYTKD_03270 [Planctomycetota bacterium]|jgi:hypothetical protein